MIFKEFGDKNAPAIIFLHGGGLSWWSWEAQIERLQKNYRVITPVIDGHGDAWNTIFAGIKKTAESVINYIKEHCNGQVFALCGLSLGAQIVVEVLSKEPGIAENAVIESALVYPFKLTVALA
ncbi:MAG: alpha/beta hydrolase, partial [Dehalococcoidales bacterium]|nr:alpha/beta hydrolase [Dehalococcoidales bacterium]